MEAPPVRYVTTRDGFNIAYTVEGAGLPYVAMPFFFHHVIAARPLRSHVLPSLTPRFRVILYDHRGQGMSTRDLPEAHSWEDYQYDLRALVDRLDLSSFVLSAPHWYAAAGVRFAVENPGRVQALVLYFPMLEGQGEPMDFRSLAARNWDLFLEVAARTYVPNADHSRVVQLFRQCTSQRDFLRAAHSFEQQSVASLLSKLTVPTLVVTAPTGTWNFALDDMHKSLAAKIPSARLVMAENAGEVAQAMEAFLQEALSAAETGAAAVEPGRDVLTAREVEVLKLMAAGKTNKQIAAEFALSVFTVQHHVSNILTKAHLNNRTEAAAYAHRMGLARPG